MDYEQKLTDLENRIAKLEKIEKKRKIRQIISIVFKVIFIIISCYALYKLYSLVMVYKDSLDELLKMKDNFNIENENLQKILDTLEKYNIFK